LPENFHLNSGHSRLLPVGVRRRHQLPPQPKHSREISSAIRYSLPDESVSGIA